VVYDRRYAGDAMRVSEAIGFLALLVFTIVLFLVGAAPLEDGGAVLIGLGALGWLIYTRHSLKKQGVPWWCSAEAARFHKFKETGNPAHDPRIWECSACGVHRQVWSVSSDTSI